MDQFGLKMNFLCILQVSRIVFVLKLNSIIISYYPFARQKLKSAGALALNMPRHRPLCYRLRVNFPKNLRFLMQMCRTKGYRVILIVRSSTDDTIRSALDKTQLSLTTVGSKFDGRESPATSIHF
jgi:hypothetical protein